MSSAKNLVKYGFVKKEYSKIAKALQEKADSMDEKEAKKYADQESFEMRRDSPDVSTSFPTPHHRYRIVHETFKQSIESQYFWIVNYMYYDMDLFIDKIYDLFAASEQSAFFGVAQQRLGLQQDRVSGFLATIGKMVKELFQLVRELRILDERLSYYEDSYKKDSPSRDSAEITLKGVYIDTVEGGAKSPASVYGMSRELQFTVLPDLFFKVHPVTSRDVDAEVDKLEFNLKVKEVLKRKLRSYMEWKEHTHKELKTKRVFTLKYLRQHYDIIKLYMDWVRPYLKNIRRLQLVDRTVSPDLIGAFEGSLVEIEILGKKKLKGSLEKYNSCLLITFNYRTKAHMEATQPGEYQHKGAIHFGRNEITLRTYAWDDEQIAQYKKMKEEEDMELLGIIDASVKAAMEALGDELKNYLEQAGESFGKKKEEPEQKPGIMQRFAADFRKSFVSSAPTTAKKAPPKKEKLGPYRLSKEKAEAERLGKDIIWNTYKNYKKAHRMLSW